MLVPVHATHPEKRLVQQVLGALRDGLVLILPTDTVYALVCLSDQPRAITELYRIKGLSEKQPLSLLCRDVAMASNYARSFSNQVFRFMKGRTPGPYTFILPANRNVDRRGIGKKKEVGVRIVDHPLHIMLMEQLDIPLVSTSLTIEDGYHTDPEDLDRKYGHQVHWVVHDGIRAHEYSTVLDCTGPVVVLVREGRGSIEELDIIEEG